MHRSELRMVGASEAEIITALARRWFSGRPLPHLTNGTLTLDWLGAVVDISDFEDTAIPARLQCGTSPTTVREVAATLRNRIAERL